ncbi:MAG: hypothetical protein HQL87_13315 [Magnetococcales bacterium]|nr:hypothetical protein [Magnetococcales bacterium]
MSCAIGTNNSVNLRRWSWVLTAILSVMVANAFAAPDIRLPPPTGVYDYHTFGSGNTTDKELYFSVPKEVELFGDPEQLKALCVNLGGLSIGVSKLAKIMCPESGPCKTQKTCCKITRYGDFYGAKNRAKKSGRKVPFWTPQLSIGWPKKDVSQEETPQEGTPEGEASKHKDALKKRLEDNFNEYFGSKPKFGVWDDAENRCRKLTKPSLPEGDQPDLVSKPADLNVDDKKVESIKVEVENEGAELKDQRLVIRFDDKNNHWVSLGSVTQFVNCVTQQYHQDPNEEKENRKDLHCNLDPQDESIFSNSSLIQFFLTGKKKTDHFLSRAFLSPQNLCGVNVKDGLEQAKHCRVSELIRVELVEGHVEKITVSSKDPKNSLFDMISEYFSSAKEKYQTQSTGDRNDKRVNSEVVFPATLVDLLSGNKEKEEDLIKKFKDENFNKLVDYFISNKKQAMPLLKKILDDEYKEQKEQKLNETCKVHRVNEKCEEFKKYIGLLGRGEKITELKELKDIKELNEVSKTDDVKKILEEIGIYYDTLWKSVYETYKKVNDSIEENKRKDFDLYFEMLGIYNSKKVKCDQKAPKDSSLMLVPSKLCEILGPLQNEKPLSRLQLERTLMEASSLPGVTVTGTLEPPSKNETREGVTNLNVLTEFQRVELSAGADNYGNDYMGPWLYWGRIGVNYLLTPGDKFSWLYVKEPQKEELSHYQLDYRFPLPLAPNGFYGRFFFLKDNGNLGGPLESLNIKTKEESGEVALGHTLQIDRYWKRSIEGGLNITDVNTALLGSDLNHDSVAKGFIKIDFNYHDSIQELGNQKTPDLPGLQDLTITMKALQGIKLGNYYSAEGGYTTSNPNAGPDFFQLQGNIKWLREFKKILQPEYNISLLKWLGEIEKENTHRLYISGEAGGQLSTEPVLAPGKMSFGGRNFGTAYNAGKISGDDAFAIKGELGYKILTGFDPHLESCGNDPIQTDLEISPFGLVEVAQVWNTSAQDQLRGTQRDEIMSGGGGVRLQLTPERLGRLKRHYWTEVKISDQSTRT